jgi:hypothetical protein
MVIFIQLIGGLIFSIINLFNNFMLNIWFGGCVLTPFGFIAGYYWHKKNSLSGVGDKNVIYIMAMICIMLFLSSIIFIKFYNYSIIK